MSIRQPFFVFKILSIHLGMEIKNNLLYVDGKQVQMRKSPNVGGKIKDHKFLIAHYTAASTAESAISWMASPESKVSAHLHLDRNGVFVQQVAFDTVAWHAGSSHWKDYVGINSWSIGIEMQNTGTQEYTEVQIRSFIEVSKLLVKTYGIEEILGHSDIAPGRKMDPGNLFPMTLIRESVFDVKDSLVKHTTTDVNLRKGAGTNFEALQVIKSGTEVSVLSEKDSWTEVFICTNKSRGWIKSSYIK